jgi:hypothetical protein
MTDTVTVQLPFVVITGLHKLGMIPNGSGDPPQQIAAAIGALVWQAMEADGLVEPTATVGSPSVAPEPAETPAEAPPAPRATSPDSKPRKALKAAAASHMPTNDEVAQRQADWAARMGAVQADEPTSATS